MAAYRHLTARYPRQGFIKDGFMDFFKGTGVFKEDVH